MVHVIRLYCDKILEKDKAKFPNFFKELFLSKFVEIVKKCDHYEKREKGVEMLYWFFPKESVYKHEAIRIYKEKISDMQLFIQSLAILLSQEKEETEENKNLLKDFKFYAKYALKDKKVYVRLNGLLMMSKLCEIDYEWVQKIMLRYVDCVSTSDWWENRMMTVIVYCKVLRKLADSEPYQKLIKLKSNDMTKVMTNEVRPVHPRTS